MPKFIAHGLTGMVIVAALSPNVDFRKWVPLTIGAILAISPDFDFAIEWIFNFQNFHRGFSHSIFFSALVALTLSFLVRNLSELTGYSLAYLSHSILDSTMSTSGGVKFFYPFSLQYYNFGLTSLFELPIGRDFGEAFHWIWIETACFLPVLILLFTIKHFLKRTKCKNFVE